MNLAPEPIASIIHYAKSLPSTGLDNTAKERRQNTSLGILQYSSRNTRVLPLEYCSTFAEVLTEEGMESEG